MSKGHPCALLLDLHDAFSPELEKLQTISSLLSWLRPEDVDGRSLGGVALLLEDIHTRMRAVLRARTPKS